MVLICVLIVVVRVMNLNYRSLHQAGKSVPQGPK
jgi:hypothetical protein